MLNFIKSGQNKSSQNKSGLNNSGLNKGLEYNGGANLPKASYKASKSRFLPSSNRGFTVIELMVSLTILLIVLALAYNLLYSGMTFFKQGEERWLEQREIKKLGDFIESSITLSHRADIFEEETPSFEEGFNYIYRGEDDLIYFKPKDEEAPSAITSQNLSLIFARVQEDSVNIPKALAYNIASLRPNGYKLGSTVFFPNMLISARVNATGGSPTENSVDAGNVLRFVTDESLVSGLDASVVGCFIATAAYGSYDQQNVMLLRRFRDDFLLKTAWGAKFTRLYYKYSPPLANIIRQNPVLKGLSAILLLPLIGLAAALIYPVLPLVLGLIFALIFYGFKKYLFKGVAGFRLRP